MKGQSNGNYRKDIDGLRAFAVIFVVIFHLFPAWLPGGFIGVDIFFVISGFLISNIIFNKLNNNAFSFTEFYSHRIRRIFPSLLVVLIFSLLFGWFAFLSDEYMQLGKHISTSSGFIQNFLLWHEAGYFDIASETKPLLHLWSLGIEEQFYIIWPLLLWFIIKSKLNKFTMLLFLMLFSFGINIGRIHTNPVEVFYSPLTRFWELSFGGLLSFYSIYRNELVIKIRNKLDRILNKIIYESFPAEGKTFLDFSSIVGLILIFLSLILISRDSEFPGIWALLPVLGTYLLISAGENAFVNRLVLSNRIFVWVGLISYPFYLWHYILLSHARIYFGEFPSRGNRILIFFFSIVLSWLTFQIIEKPIRFGKYNRIKVIFLILSMFIVFLSGITIFLKEGFPKRAFQKKYTNYSDSIKTYSPEDNCFDIEYNHEKENNWYKIYGLNSNSTKIFAYGDSHSLSMLPVLEKIANTLNIQILSSGFSGCPPFLGIQSIRGDQNIHNCSQLNQRIYEYVKQNNIKFVFLIARWSYYTGGSTRPTEINLISMDITKDTDLEFSRKSFEYGLIKTVEMYANIGVHVFIFEDNPQQKIDPKDALKKAKPIDSEINKLSISLQEHMNNQSYANKLFNNLKKQSNVTIIKSSDILCDTSHCPLAKNDHFLYSDDDHLSIFGSYLLYDRLYNEIGKYILKIHNR